MLPLLYFTFWVLFFIRAIHKVIVFSYHKKTTSILILNKNIYLVLKI